MPQQHARDFATWLDRQCSLPIPSSARAYNINLYQADDSIHVELIGASRYDAENADWACDEVFASRPDLLILPKADVGEEWEAALKVLVAWAKSYLADLNNRGGRLREAKAVTVGFVDGDLERVWPPEPAA
jgi:hypothetical protein